MIWAALMVARLLLFLVVTSGMTVAVIEIITGRGLIARLRTTWHRERWPVTPQDVRLEGASLLLWLVGLFLLNLAPSVVPLGLAEHPTPAPAPDAVMIILVALNFLGLFIVGIICAVAGAGLFLKIRYGPRQLRHGGRESVPGGSAIEER